MAGGGCHAARDYRQQCLHLCRVVPARGIARRWMAVERFFTVGFACALLHNAIMIGGDWLGLHYAVSSLLSFVIVSAFGYRLHSRWTFPGALRGRTRIASYSLTMRDT